MQISYTFKDWWCSFCVALSSCYFYIENFFLWKEKTYSYVCHKRVLLYRRVLVFFLFQTYLNYACAINILRLQSDNVQMYTHVSCSNAHHPFFSILLVRKIQVIINTNRRRIHFIIQFEIEQNWFLMLKTVVMTQHMGFIV